MDFTATRKQLLIQICADVEVQTGTQGVTGSRLDENGEFVGGISKFLQDRKEAVIAGTGPEKGRFCRSGCRNESWKHRRLPVRLRKIVGELPWNAIWIRNAMNSAGSWTSPCMRSARSPASWNSAIIPSPCLRAAWKALEETDPLEIYAYQYDLVCNGVELSSGAVRNHDPEIMIKAFELVGLGEEDVKAKFPAMYNAFCYGAPPHAGIAPGVDRMVMLIWPARTASVRLFRSP